MGQLVELFDEDVNTTGIKQVSLPAYQTSDGTIFNTKNEAEEHEASEQLVKTLVKKYQRWDSSDRVGGWTMRGDGWEFVTADNGKMESYTRYIISQIKG